MSSMNHGRTTRRAGAKHRARGSRTGMVLILALGVLVLVSMLAIFFYMVTRSEKDVAIDQVNLLRAEFLAQNGLEIAKKHLTRPPRDVSWPDPVEIRTYFKLAATEMGDMTTWPSMAAVGHPGTPFFINWNAVVTPGYDDRSQDEFSVKPLSALPTFMRNKFSDGEPFEDTGYSYTTTGGKMLKMGAGDKKFSFADTNGNGVHDIDETSCEKFTDLNHNGVHDSYAGAVTFAVDDIRGAYSLNVMDNGGLIHINDGTTLGKDWLPDWAKRRFSSSKQSQLKAWLVKQHSRHVVKMLDNLGVILGLFTPDETYYIDESDPNFRNRLKPTGEGAGYLLIYGSKKWGVDGRPEGGYPTKNEVRRAFNQIQQKKKTSLTDRQIDLFLSMITTVAWVDKTTVVGARFLYPEEYDKYTGEYRNDYIRFEAVTEQKDNQGQFGNDYERVLRIRESNPTAILTPGRAEEDAEPRYNDKMLGDDWNNVPRNPTIVDDPDGKMIEGDDKDDDLDNLMGWLYEPRAPININSAPQPVIEAALTYLEAAYVCDRENNLYPNGQVIADYRIDTSNVGQIFLGTPANNFYYDPNNYWNLAAAPPIYEGMKNYWDQDPITKVFLQYGYKSGNLYNWTSFSIIRAIYSGQPSYSADFCRPETIAFLLERVNPTIRGTPSVIIFPEEARALAAAIVEYRNGGDTFTDKNANGILDYGDNTANDGVLKKGREWTDRDGDGFYQGGPFKSYEEFFVFLHMQKFRLFQTQMIPNKPTSKNYGIIYYAALRDESRVTDLLDLKVDLIFANANPNVDALAFNPNASFAALNRISSKGRYVRRNISRFDLFDVEGKPTHTTEFCFNPTGIFQIESTGRVIAADGTPLAERTIRSAVRVFDTMRLTSQSDFEMGPNPGTYAENDVTTHDDHFFNSNIAAKTRMMTLPEAEWRATGLDGNQRKDGWQANAAGYDGQIMLATRFVTDREMNNSRSGPYALRAYARFSAGEGGSDDWLGGRLTDSAETSHVQDELNLRLTTFDEMGWVRAVGNLRKDMLNDLFVMTVIGGGQIYVPTRLVDSDYRPTRNWEYDFENHRIHTSYDWWKMNGELDYQRYPSSGAYPRSVVKNEKTNELLVRPLMQPASFPLVGCNEEYYSNPASDVKASFNAGNRIYPFSELSTNSLAPSQVYHSAWQTYNNRQIFPMTVPRYDRDSNLAADGFMKMGARSIYYDLTPVFDDPNTPEYDGYSTVLARTEAESRLLANFSDSLVFKEWYGSGTNCLTLLVEMWVKPMFSAVHNNNSVHDGNWEDMMEWEGNCRWQGWAVPPFNRPARPQDYHPQAAHQRCLDIDFSYLCRTYKDKRGVPLPPQISSTQDQAGTSLSIKAMLKPLQYVPEAVSYTVVFNQNSTPPYRWMPRRTLNITYKSNYVDNPSLYSWLDAGRYPEYIDDPAVIPSGHQQVIRDGEWFHVAFVAMPKEVAWLINGRIIGTTKNIATSLNPFPNFGITKIHLPEFSCTVDELKIYTMLGSRADAGNRLMEHLMEGRYYGDGAYISPKLSLPAGSRIEGINWTQLIPRTLDLNADKTGVKLILLDGDGRAVRDEDGREVELTDPNNTATIGASLTSFRIKIEMKAAPKRDYWFNSGQISCLIDSPVVDDITIFHSYVEEVLLWEIVE